MKITLIIPDESTSLGLFLNYKNPVLTGVITTTNALIRPKEGLVACIDKEGNIVERRERP